MSIPIDRPIFVTLFFDFSGELQSGHLGGCEPKNPFATGASYPKLSDLYRY
jgi:hypothetical protein